MCRRLILAVGIVASPASLLAAPPDSPTAQTVEGDERKKADDLFRAGRQLMREGRVEEACPLLEQSQALDPAGGTLLNLSRCYESLGRFASADAVLARAWRIGRVKGRADAIDFIEAERVRVAPAIDHVVLVLASLPPEAIVELDGKVIAERAPRVTLDIDPGKHEASVRAQGYVEVRVGFELAPKDDLEGRVVEIRLPALSRRRDEGKPAPPPSFPAPPRPRRPQQRARQARPPRRSSCDRPVRSRSSQAGCPSLRGSPSVPWQQRSGRTRRRSARSAVAMTRAPATTRTPRRRQRRSRRASSSEASPSAASA